MNRKTRIAILSIVMILIFALPAVALASKQIYKASLRGNGSGGGSALIGTTSTGSWGCLVQVHGLTGDATAIRVLSTVDGSTLINICTGSGCPGQSISWTCNITPPMIPPGVTNAQILHALEAGQASVNVETAANPGGEIWGVLQ